MKHLFALEKGFVLLALAAITLTHFSLSLHAQTAIPMDRKTDSQQTSRAMSADIAPKVSAYMDALVKAGWFSGSILIAQNGKVLVSKGYGMANVELDVPNTPQTKFRVGSVTKVFTAIGIMLLQERGKLSLQDSICRYLADCPASWQPITIHHLLSDTSGLAQHDTAGLYLHTAMRPMSLPQLIET